MSWLGRHRVLGACLLAGCSSVESQPSAALDGGLSDAARLADAAASLANEDDGFEGCPDSVPAFALDMQATGEQGHINATLLAASNVPPLRYLNSWTVAFSAQGAPLSDVVLTKARPFMPVHGHDGIVQPMVESL
ncbi:MAG: hypothetical protein JWN04_3183, partial [Myxococcaceae bacterium]|nr:hypothetical protein [Myxococcaceae bacterium]